MYWKTNKVLTAHVLTQNNSLLNCPFCNSIAFLNNTYTAHYWVECKSCHCEVPANNRIASETFADNDDIDAHIESINSAVANWNKRHSINVTPPRVSKWFPPKVTQKKGGAK